MPAAVSATTAPAAGSIPTRIEIPSQGISARVISESVAPSGALQIPANPRLVGWWRGGARPGASMGTTVVAGHVDTRRQGAGAFYKLERLQPGDLIYLKAANGSTVTYRVVARRAYRKTALPADLFTRRGTPRLVLVTCGGAFDRISATYRYNVVVYGLPA